MQSVLLSKNELLRKIRRLSLLLVFAGVGCTENGLPEGYEDGIELNRKPTAGELENLRVETVKEMCKEDSEYRDLAETEKECLAAYSGFLDNCNVSLVSAIPKTVSTTAFVTYSLEYARCLNEKRFGTGK